MLHVPEDSRTAKTCGYAKVRVWLWERRQEVTVATSILPGDQLTGVLGCEKVPIRPITTWEAKKKTKGEMKSRMTIFISLSKKTFKGLKNQSINADQNLTLEYRQKGFSCIINFNTKRKFKLITLPFQ